jgi:hypothetical protein
MINVKFIRSIVEQVTELDLSNGNRKRDYSDARAIYYKICRDMTKSTIEYIGKEVGRDHATVLHGIKNVFPVVDKQLYVEVMNKIDSTSPVTERLEGIAKRLSEEVLPIICRKVDWQIADTDLDGDDYAAIHASVTRLVINKMLLQTKYDC